MLFRSVGLTSHISKGRGAVGLAGRAPDEEIPVLVGKEIHVETIVHQFHTHIRLIVGEVSVDVETFVVTLLAVALVGKEIQSAADVKVTDAAGVGEVETFVERIAYTAEKAVAQQGLYRIFVLFPERFVTPLVIAVVGVVIDSYIEIGRASCRERVCLYV